MKQIYLASTLLCTTLFLANCASTQKDGYSSTFNSNANQSNHQYCEDQSCISAECKGEHLTENCRFVGTEALKPMLNANSKFFEEKIKNSISLWEKHCSSQTSNPKIICHEGDTKIQKPNAVEIANSSEESLSKVKNGKKHIFYRQVYILKP